MTAEGASVWIVRQGEYNGADDILGVFASEADALLFMAEYGEPRDHFTVDQYRIGYRVDVDD